MECHAHFAMKSIIIKAPALKSNRDSTKQQRNAIRRQTRKVKKTEDDQEDSSTEDCSNDDAIAHAHKSVQTTATCGVQLKERQHIHYTLQENKISTFHVTFFTGSNAWRKAFRYTLTLPWSKLSLTVCLKNKHKKTLQHRIKTKAELLP